MAKRSKSVFGTMCHMNTFDFTTVPVIGKIMEITGINDGWIVVALILLILAVIFLVGWILSAGKARSSRKELQKLEQEILGLQAMTNLPPLSAADYNDGGDPGTSMVFASTKELKRRRETQAFKPVASPWGDDEPESKPTAQPVDKPATQPIANAKATAKNAEPSVTAQVHKAIFDSVTSGGKMRTTEPEVSDSVPAKSDMVGNRKRKANGAAITSSDLPPIQSNGNQRKQPVRKHEAADPDASLSSRIPRL